MDELNKTNIKKLTVEELNDTLYSLREKLFAFNCKSANGKEINYKDFHKIRKNISRILTELSNRELIGRTK